MNPTMKCN